MLPDVLYWLFCWCSSDRQSCRTNNQAGTSLEVSEGNAPVDGVTGDINYGTVDISTPKELNRNSVLQARGETGEESFAEGLGSVQECRVMTIGDLQDEVNDNDVEVLRDLAFTPRSLGKLLKDPTVIASFTPRQRKLYDSVTIPLETFQTAAKWHAKDQKHRNGSMSAAESASENISSTHNYSRQSSALLPLPPGFALSYRHCQNSEIEIGNDERYRLLTDMFRDFVLELNRGLYLTQMAANREYVNVHCSLDDGLDILTLDQNTGRLIEFPIPSIERLFTKKIWSRVARPRLQPNSAGAVDQPEPRQYNDTDNRDSDNYENTSTQKVLSGSNPPPAIESLPNPKVKKLDLSKCTQQFDACTKPNLPKPAIDYIVIVEFEHRKLIFVFGNEVQARRFEMCMMMLAVKAESPLKNSFPAYDVAPTASAQLLRPATENSLQALPVSASRHGTTNKKVTAEVSENSSATAGNNASAVWKLMCSDRQKQSECVSCDVAEYDKQAESVVNADTKTLSVEKPENSRKEFPESPRCCSESQDESDFKDLNLFGESASDIEAAVEWLANARMSQQYIEYVDDCQFD